MAKNVSQTTTDHDTIRRWAEERGGSPAEVGATAREGQTGIIRIDFPGWSGEGKLRRISWDEWFEKFDESGLALVYEEETAGGQRSNFNKLVSRETAAARSRGTGSSRRSGGRGSRGGSRTPARGGRTAARAKARGSSRASGGRGGPKRSTRAGGRRQASSGEAARTTRGGRATSRSGRGAAKGRSAGGRSGTRSGKARTAGRKTRSRSS